jgi:hypothetical protein
MDSREWSERYLQEVRKYLPWHRQDDIIAELRANLDAQREEREAELGRPLTEGEMIDWLKELGPPLEMAARYQPPRHLIGPTIFPLYWHILRLVAIWATFGYAISIVARIVVESHSAEWIGAQVLEYPGILITIAAWITGAFAVLEFISERYPEKCPDFMAPASRWSPANLPPLDKQIPAGTKPRNLMALSAELVVRFAVLVWLLLIPQNPFLLLGPGAAYLKSGPVVLLPVILWFYWSVVVLNMVEFVWQGYNILADRWRQKNMLQHLVTQVFGLVPIAILIAAPAQSYLAANPLATHALPPGLSIAALNHYIFTGFVIVGVIKIVQFAWDIWKATMGERNPLRAVLLP